MTIPREVEAEILRLYHAEKWTVTTIATQLDLHHSAVKRVLLQDGLSTGKIVIRRSMTDAYVPFMQATLKKYPKLTATRLYEMVKARGYQGGIDHFRDVVARHRPRPAAEAYLRVRTLPGEQAQVDWAHFGKIKIGDVERRLLAFVMVLSWCRSIFLRFYLGDGTANFFRGHVEAFSHFGAVPRVILYDNLKSAVIERIGSAIRFNPALLELAAYYRFAPQPVAVARGNEKGRVERAIQYARHSFFAGREYTDLDDLNRQALEWCQGTAAQRRCAEDRKMTVAEAFELEKESLLALPENPYPVHEKVAVRIGKTPYARFDGCDYSVPHTMVRRTLLAVADLDTVRILDGPSEVACHKRSWQRGQQIENPQHVADLQDWKQEAKVHRGMDRLYHAVPCSRKLLEMAAEQGQNLGGITTGLLKLLDLYGVVELEQAIREAVAAELVSATSVRHVLERRRREQALPPPVPVAMPDDPRIKNLVVVPHNLEAYDALHTCSEVASNG